MTTQAYTGLTFDLVTANDEQLINDIATSLVDYPEKTRLLFGAAPDAKLSLESFLEHIDSYGTGMSVIKNDEGAIIGMGGLQFINEVQMFELVCCMLPEYESLAYDATDMLRSEAFEKMSLDKICARATDGSLQSLVYRENGFIYIDERAFTADGVTHIWNYYELENDTNTTTVSDIFTNWYQTES